IEPNQAELTNVVIEEVDTFLSPEDSIPPGIESNFYPGGILLYFSPPGVKKPFLTLTSLLSAGGISLGWNFHDYPDFEDSRAHGFVYLYIRASYPQLHLGNPIS
ncbi:hypothetical protein Tco_1366454, partial [Tanacetum coccineum]